MGNCIRSILTTGAFFMELQKIVCKMSYTYHCKSTLMGLLYFDLQSSPCGQFTSQSMNYHLLPGKGRGIFCYFKILLAMTCQETYMHVSIVYL